MVIRKIIGLLFAVLPVQIGAAQENPYDNAIGEAISRSDWFETRARYEQSADSLSDYMRLFSGALLDHNLDRMDGSRKSSTCTMSTTPKWAATFSHCSG
jgi:hypothetical protein